MAGLYNLLLSFLFVSSIASCTKKRPDVPVAPAPTPPPSTVPQPAAVQTESKIHDILGVDLSLDSKTAAEKYKARGAKDLSCKKTQTGAEVCSLKIPTLGVWARDPETVDISKYKDANGQINEVGQSSLKAEKERILERNMLTVTYYNGNALDLKYSIGYSDDIKPFADAVIEEANKKYSQTPKAINADGDDDFNMRSGCVLEYLVYGGALDIAVFRPIHIPADSDIAPGSFGPNVICKSFLNKSDIPPREMFHVTAISWSSNDIFLKKMSDEKQFEATEQKKKDESLEKQKQQGTGI